MSGSPGWKGCGAAGRRCQGRGHPRDAALGGSAGAEPTPLPPSPPRAALTFIWRRGEPGQLCLLLAAERSLRKPQRNSSSRGSIPPPPPSSSPHGTLRWGAAPDLGPLRASSAACSVPVPARPGTGTAAPSAPSAAAEPPPRSPTKPFPASNESPAHGRASPQHIIMWFFFSLPSGPRCELASSQAPQQTRPPAEPTCHLTSPPRGWQALAHAPAPPKLHQGWPHHPKTLSWVQGRLAAP